MRIAKLVTVCFVEEEAEVLQLARGYAGHQSKAQTLVSDFPIFCL